PARWIRLHVICGDANRLASATKRKVGLVKLALTLAQHGIAPPWKIADPVFSFQAVSRDESYRFPVDLRGGDSSSAEAILESYFEAADGLEEPDSDLLWTSRTSRELLRELKSDWNRFRRHADWAAKRSMIETFLVAEGVDWTDSRLQSFDLEYANLDPEEGLFSALVEMGEVEPGVSAAIAAAALDEPPCDSTRAQARALAVTRFGDALRDASWGSLTFEIDSRREVVDLPPDLRPSPELAEIQDVVSFIKRLRGDK
ncbi:MAG: proteasome accessory factor PafA2 family protein, partial [Fimbriimonas ginsengisoli]|nr:proteasome accessory factor PafA2 family protein [Fimbriimonas ginsengisoli]